MGGELGTEYINIRLCPVLAVAFSVLNKTVSIFSEGWVAIFCGAQLATLSKTEACYLLTNVSCITTIVRIFLFD